MNETANLAGERGGSGAPVNEVPAASEAGAAGGTQNQSGAGNAEQTQAAWMSQLSRELRENPNAQKALGGFKTISELVEAFMSRTESAEPEDGGRDAFEKRLEEAAEAKREPPAWLDARAVKETTEKLVGEFGPEAAAYYKKALGHKDLGAVLAEAGLKSHPEIGRALVLLGREMSEDSTVPGRRAGSGHEPVTLAEGARLY